MRCLVEAESSSSDHVDSFVGLGCRTLIYLVKSLSIKKKYVSVAEEIPVYVRIVVVSKLILILYVKLDVPFLRSEGVAICLSPSHVPVLVVFVHGHREGDVCGDSVYLCSGKDCLSCCYCVFIVSI